MKLSPEEIRELRKLRGQGMESAVGEYTPPELWDALDEIERLREFIATSTLYPVSVLRIDRTLSLDPVTVYLEDSGGGAGRATIVCYNQAWTCYWAAMGDRTLLQFIAECDEHYVAGNMLTGRWRIGPGEREYAERVARAVIAAAKKEA